MTDKLDKWTCSCDFEEGAFGEQADRQKKVRRINEYKSENVCYVEVVLDCLVPFTLRMWQKVVNWTCWLYSGEQN